MKTALNQLEDWILKFEKQNGTPTMCEIKAQLEMFKEVEKEIIIEAFESGTAYAWTDNPEYDANDCFKETFIDSLQAE